MVTFERLSMRQKTEYEGYVSVDLTYTWLTLV